MFRTIVAAALMICMTGCAKYEYDLVAPTDLRRHVGSAGPERVIQGPLEYRLQTFDNHLVMEIVNPTEDAIGFLGDRSYVVSPDGQSHPLRGQTIAPGTFIKLILPPVRPTYRSDGPDFGFGLGIGIGRANRRSLRTYDAALVDEPRYYTYVDGGDVLFWDWSGETGVRLHLLFSSKQGEIAHDFTFSRRKL